MGVVSVVLHQTHHFYLRRMYPTVYKNKTELLHEFDKNLLAYLHKSIKDSHNSLYNKLLDPETSIYILGNGSTRHAPANIVDEINRTDVVIRLNNWYEDQDIEKTGTKCDIHIVNCALIRKKKSFADIIKDKSYLIIENGSRCSSNPNRPNVLCNSNRFTDYVETETCKRNLSRGMIILVLLHNFYRNIKLLGFGGSGHHYEPNKKLAHSITKVENTVIKNLIKADTTLVL